LEARNNSAQLILFVRVVLSSENVKKKLTRSTTGKKKMKNKELKKLLRCAFKAGQCPNILSEVEYFEHIEKEYPDN
jgi:hypothetical protein